MSGTDLHNMSICWEWPGYCFRNCKGPNGYHGVCLLWSGATMNKELFAPANLTIEIILFFVIKHIKECQVQTYYYYYLMILAWFLLTGVKVLLIGTVFLLWSSAILWIKLFSAGNLTQSNISTWRNNHMISCLQYVFYSWWWLHKLLFTNSV